MFYNLFTLFLFVQMVNVIIAWPSGAPEKVCGTLQPVHGNNQPRPATSSPFVITQSHSSYTPGDRVKVTIQSSTETPFRGLIIQAYDPTTGHPLGTFQPGRGLKPLDSCGAVTHSDRRDKRSATLVWEAPSNPTGSSQIAFRGTMVQSYSDIYSGLQSVLESA